MPIISQVRLAGFPSFRSRLDAPAMRNPAASMTKMYFAANAVPLTNGSIVFAGRNFRTRGLVDPFIRQTGEPWRG